RPPASGVHLMTPGPRRNRPVWMTLTSYGGSTLSTRISSRRTAGPSVVTASMRVPTPPSPATTRTVVTGIHSPWRSHATNAPKTRCTGARIPAVAVTSPAPGAAGSCSGAGTPLRPVGLVGDVRGTGFEAAVGARVGGRFGARRRGLVGVGLVTGD